MAGLDTAGRKIAGLLGYNPGPGIYSRLERAIQAMPANVRVQELPGLLKRYKEGVPGWELRAADLDSIIAGRDVVPQDELLAAVRERSPVYTHREVILGGSPQREKVGHGFFDIETAINRGMEGEAEWVPEGTVFPQYQERPMPLGQGVSHGSPRYEAYGQGGRDYTEILLQQPGAKGAEYGSHWTPGYWLTDPTVAHARYDIHGDALRINELQSDLGIHNRKMREANQKLIGGDAESVAMKDRRESDESYIARMREMGYGVQRAYGGGWTITSAANTLPFPLEDAWFDILIKRLALEAARGGHRAIEVASPRAIADKVGGNIDNYEHFYGKVIPGAIERLGRKMGGLVDDTDAPLEAAAWRARGSFNDDLNSHIDRMVALADLPDVAGTKLSGPRHAAERLLGDLGANTWRLNSGNYPQNFPAKQIQGTIAENLAAIVGPHRMNEMYLRASEIAAAEAARKHAVNSVTDTPMPTSLNPPGRRYIMSDEMRRRLIEGGVGASLLGGLAGMMGGEE